MLSSIRGPRSTIASMPRVLIADDDRLVRKFLHDALATAGYDVVAATDGAEAIQLIAAAGRFDLVVTDYSMPAASGIDVINHAQRIDPTLPCIIVTAFHDLDLAMRGMQAGAVGFIPKPFKAEHLLTVAGRALERRQMATDTTRLTLLLPMLERFTMLLANTLESKDCATGQHAERLVEHSEAVARELGIDEDARFSIRVGACLHDIGKVGVPEALLRKPTKLTPAEREVMQLHPEIGAAILEDIDTWQDVRLIVRHHHEHWNGAGYPHGLQGVDIPLGARIVSVVDAYDVMSEGRPYAPARPLEAVVRELVRQRGRQFDADVVDAFLRTLSAAGHYHDVVDTVAELNLISRRAGTGAHSTRTAVGATL
jgi:putative two-component system response regulator